jgi:macrolide-specific efflux system membrane fusion protein
VLTVPIGALTFADAGRRNDPALRAEGGVDAGRRGRGGAATARAAAPRQAIVRVVAADGTITEREVTVGVTSRVAAEVISGLNEGEQVVAGIAQTGAPAGAGNNNQNNNRFPGGGFPGGGFPGGFPGGR